MIFDPPLTPARLIKRYKRFLADVEFDDGTQITAHCANTGTMLGLKEPGARIWLSKSDNPKRKLQWSWEIIEADGTKVGINTAHPNRLVENAIRAGDITELCEYPILQREQKYGENSKIDILLTNEHDQKCYVEVKNVHLLREPGLAEFPDAVTARGTKHLYELTKLAEKGIRAVMFYLIQREDCDRFQIADDIDPVYAEALNKAHRAGVEILAYKCSLSETEISITQRIDWDPKSNT